MEKKRGNSTASARRRKQLKGRKRRLQRRRRIIFLAAAVCVLAAVLLVWRLVSARGGGANVNPAATQGATAAPQTTLPPELTASGGTLLTDLSGFDRRQGGLSLLGSWTGLNEKNQHIVVPIDRPGSTLWVEAGSSTLYFAAAQFYSEPKLNEKVAFSEAEGWNGRMMLTPRAGRVYELPEDARWLILEVVCDGVDASPARFALSAPASPDHPAATATAAPVRPAAPALIDDPVVDGPIEIADLGGLERHDGSLSAENAVWDNVTARFQHVVIPVRGGERLSLTAGATATYCGVLTHYEPPAAGQPVYYSAESGWTSARLLLSNGTFAETLPDDARYLIVMVTRAGRSTEPIAFSLTTPSGGANR